MREQSLASVGQDRSELRPRFSLRLGLHRNAVSNYTVWKCARAFGWKVSERRYKLNVCVKWDTEGLVTLLQLDSHFP